MSDLKHRVNFSQALGLNPEPLDLAFQHANHLTIACGREEGGQVPCGRPHRKLKLESIDVILSSSHEKKLASFLNPFS